MGVKILSISIINHLECKLANKVQNRYVSLSNKRPISRSQSVHIIY